MCEAKKLAAYGSGEELQSTEGGPPLRQRRRVHGLRQHQEGPRHQEQEEVEEQQGLQEQEVREDGSTEAPAHPLERHVPQLEGVQERQPAVPTVSGGLRDNMWRTA